MQEHSEMSNETKDQVSADFCHLPDSDSYIRKLETRLSKVKGLHKKITAKDMVDVLQKARDDYMSRLVSSGEQLSIIDSFDGDKEVAVSYVEKKLFPEKNGVTFEELQHLVESDVLAKMSGENNGESDTSIDR